MKALLFIVAMSPWLAGAMSEGQDMQHHHHHHVMDAGGMVMNANTDKLPRDCTGISTDVHFEVSAGAEFAKAPGNIFGMNRYDFEAPPCSRITVRFTNDDEVRHQWMVHGLPRYLYPGGMFHIEADGGVTMEGTFIVPSDRKTYLVHCDVAQHMEKGMKAQLRVAGGDGNLFSVPGVSRAYRPDRYASVAGWPLLLAGLLAGGAAVSLVSLWKRGGVRKLR